MARPALKLAIEIDEKYHARQLKRDLKREVYIKSKLNCSFLRLNIGGLK